MPLITCRRLADKHCIHTRAPERWRAPEADPLDARKGLARRRSGGAAVVLAVSGLFAAWLGWHIGGPSSVRDFDDTVTALSALAATVACARAASAQLGRLRRFWLLLAAALAAWALAEVIWEVYDVVLRVPVPVPSWADVGYLGAIPLAAAALLSHPAAHPGGQRKARAALDGIVLATALLFLSWSFVLGPLWRHTDLSSLGGVVAVAYPFGDVVMLFLVVIVVRSMRSGDRFALWCVLGGIVAMAAADSTYTYLVEKGIYATGNMVDVGWVVGYLAIALGAFGSGDAQLAEAAPSPAQGEGALLSSVVLPFVPVLAALVALALKVELGQNLLLSDWLIALLLTLSVLARQALFLLEGMVTSGPAEPVPNG